MQPSPADLAMLAYYADRAGVYDRIYARPERQPDLRILEAEIPSALAGREVIEVACGTGYWTQHIARTARRVLATDLTDETLQIARTKNLPEAVVELAIADAFNLPAERGPFDGALAVFWWSHLRPTEGRAFLESLRKCLSPSALVILVDNLFVEGNSTPISRRDAEGNTWQARKLGNGATHEVLKNFPTEDELRAAVKGFGNNYRYRALEYYWVFTFEAN